MGLKPREPTSPRAVPEPLLTLLGTAQEIGRSRSSLLLLLHHCHPPHPMCLQPHQLARHRIGLNQQAPHPL
jgi:hypothetical protein